jgi:hypothetical protein
MLYLTNMVLDSQHVFLHFSCVITVLTLVRSMVAFF